MMIEPRESVIGATVRGMSLRQLPTRSEIKQIETALEKFGVLIFPDQKISPDQQIAFSAAFAPLEMTELQKARLEGMPEIFVVGNVGRGLVSFSPAEPDGELEWHSDHIHHEVAARASLLYALEVPDEGGDTLFACMYTAYDKLSQAQKLFCQDLVAIHSAEGLEHFLGRQNLGGTPGSLQGRAFNYVKRPLVRAHPVTGRRALYFGNQVTVGIEGWDRAKAADFIRDLTAHACQQAFQYRHRWSAGDAILWDNRRVLHAGTPYDVNHSRRHMHRTTWRETEPIV